jgi:hypothetical protein
VTNILCVLLFIYLLKNYLNRKINKQLSCKCTRKKFLFEHFVSLSDWNLRQLTLKRKTQTIIIPQTIVRLNIFTTFHTFLIRSKSYKLSIFWDNNAKQNMKKIVLIFHYNPRKITYNINKINNYVLYMLKLY